MEKNLLKRAAWIEVDLQALRENFVNIKALLPAETQIVAVVKANAYGHGAVPVAQCLLAEGASRLAVATLDEALELRAAGINAPIMLLGFCGDVPDSRTHPVFTAAFSRAEGRRARPPPGGRSGVLLCRDIGYPGPIDGRSAG